MDLSFRFPDPAETDALPVAELAGLFATPGERHAASVTARVQAALDGPAVERPLAPAHGAFNAGMVVRLAAWAADGSEA